MWQPSGHVVCTAHSTGPFYLLLAQPLLTLQKDTSVSSTNLVFSVWTAVSSLAAELCGPQTSDLSFLFMLPMPGAGDLLGAWRTYCKHSFH